MTKTQKSKKQSVAVPAEIIVGVDKKLRAMIAYTRSWAETTTEDEMPSPEPWRTIAVVDRHILRARALLKKHDIPFDDPSGDE